MTIDRLGQVRNIVSRNYNLTANDFNNNEQQNELSFSINGVQFTVFDVGSLFEGANEVRISSNVTVAHMNSLVVPATDNDILDAIDFFVERNQGHHIQHNIANNNLEHNNNNNRRLPN